MTLHHVAEYKQATKQNSLHQTKLKQQKGLNKKGGGIVKDDISVSTCSYMFIY